MFPLFSISGQVIGFGGRRLSKGGAKYLNSPDTPIHKKGKNLYSLWHTKEEIRKNESAILVEGYFDFLSLYQEGVKNTAACLGTSLTNEQAELLSRYADEVIIFFDKDAAGRAATLRSLGMLLNLGVTVKIGNTGSRKDPDEIILKGGVEEFKNFLSNASDFIIYTLDRIKEDYDLSSPIGLSKGIERVSIVLSQIRDPLKKELYKEIVSRKLMIREDLLNIEKSTKTSVIANKTIDISDREKIELGLFYAITQKVEEREVVFSIISDEDISNPYLKKAFRLLKKGEEIEIDDIIQSLSKNQIDYLLRESQQPEISALSSALRLKNYLLDNLIDRKRRELQKVEENGGDESMLLKEIKSLIEERVRVSKEVIGEI
jgi:DNA primase